MSKKEPKDVGELLETYSEWLEECGYTDTDWRSEEPLAIDSFLKEFSIDPNTTLHNVSTRTKKGDSKNV